MDTTAEQRNLPNVLEQNEHGEIKINLTSDEENLFEILENAAIQYETGQLTIDESLFRTTENGSGNESDRNSSTSLRDDDDDGISSSMCKPKYIEIRIAGGWVRDKLLNQDSQDVDVTLDCMTGHRFAAIVQAYLRSNHPPTTSRISSISSTDDNGNLAEKKSNSISNSKIKQKKKTKKSESHKIAVISANPSQSKHLETATMRVLGVDIDFVNLRAEEVYDPNSRIPTHRTRQFGTPLEDALRRDFTVNSMFFNIRTRMVEDFTGRGWSDLIQNQLLVTPIDPSVTFRDDPLRVLRALRFGVRYNLTLHQDVKLAAMGKHVHDSLHVKVSRERVGKELEAMISGKNARPMMALRWMTDLKLAGCVFIFPNETIMKGNKHTIEGNLMGFQYQHLTNDDERAKVRELGWIESARALLFLPTVLDALESVMSTLPDEIPPPGITILDRRMIYLLVFLLPFRHLSYTDKKDKIIKVLTYMIRDGIKFKNKDLNTFDTVMTHIDQMRAMLRNIDINQKLLIPNDNHSPFKHVFHNVSTSSPTRLQVGMLLRNLKETWITCLLVAAVSELCSHSSKDIIDLNVKAEIDSIPIRVTHFIHIVRDEYKLDNCWKIRPLLDGRDVIKSLGLPKGPVVGTYLAEQTKWMLVNPTGTKEECESHLQTKKRELEGQTKEQNENNIVVSNGSTKADSDEVLQNSHDCLFATKTGKHCSKKFHVENLKNPRS